MCHCYAGFYCCVWSSPGLSLLQSHRLQPCPFLPPLHCHNLTVKVIVIVVIVFVIVAVIVAAVVLVVVVVVVEFNCLLVGGNILLVGESLLTIHSGVLGTCTHATLSSGLPGQNKGRQYCKKPGCSSSAWRRTES
jgi:hypothetical protein